jgi:hypothetical protein
MEVIFSIIYHYLSIISNLGFHHSLKYYHFQSYVYIRVYASVYLNYKFPGFHMGKMKKAFARDAQVDSERDHGWRKG